ncbi:MAG: glycosyltransferase [Pseudomonadota bacterium]
MKRLLLHYSTLALGGAEMSSLRMINGLLDRGWQVTLVVTTGGGPAEHMVDPRTKLVRLRPAAAGGRVKAAGSLGAALAMAPDLVRAAVYKGIGLVRMLPFTLRRYDAAAVLLMGMPSTFVRRAVQAKVKAIWIRNDLGHVDPIGRVAAALTRAEPEIDHFICVSETARDALIAGCPTTAAKAEVVYNLLAPDDMRARAKAPPPTAMKTPDAPLQILTVCRLSDTSKALFRMVRVARRLLDAGHDFRWFIAGDGPDKAALQAAIDAAGLGDVMVLLGRIENPFPAYAAADVVAMLSNYEGLCGVVNEARVLEKPIIATRVSGIDEQLTDGENGLIVAQDEDAIVDGLTRLLTDAELRTKLGKGGYPAVLMDDAAKLDRLEALFLGHDRTAP